MNKLLILIALLIIPCTGQAATLSAEIGITGLDLAAHKKTEHEYRAIVGTMPISRHFYLESKVGSLGGSKLVTAEIGLKLWLFSASVGPAYFDSVPYGFSGHMQVSASAGIGWTWKRYVFKAGVGHFSNGKGILDRNDDKGFFGAAGPNHAATIATASVGVNF